MSSSGKIQSKKLKKSVAQTSANIEENDIHQLSDKNLIEIFQYLSFKDRLIVSLVCKKWNQASNASWSDIKSLKICDNFEKNYFNDLTDEKKKVSFVISIVSKCGPYLNKLTINNFNMRTKVNFSQLFKEIPKYCNNLTCFELFDDKYKNVSHSDNDLELLFNSNKNLYEVTLFYCKLVGNCFLSLNPNLIKNLALCRCIIKSKGIFYVFISRLKNLQEFEYDVKEHDYGDDENVLENTFDSLFLSDCKSLEKLFAPYTYESYGLEKLLSNQKKLQEIGFGYTAPDEKLFNSLCADSLLKIYGLECEEGLDNSFQRFHKLEYIDLKTDNFTNELALGLGKLVNLKEARIQIVEHILFTRAGVKYFKNLQNIETFKIITCMDDSIDTILSGIAQCKNVKCLKISAATFSKTGLNSLSSLPKLKELDIASTKVEEKNLENFVKKSKNLEILNVRACELITNKFVEASDNIKNKRGDTHVLTIKYGDYGGIDLKDIKNLSQLTICKKIAFSFSDD